MRSYKHSKQEIVYHLVLVTKYRRKVLTADIINNIHAAVARVLDINECELLTIGGDSDHVHIEFKAHVRVKLWSVIGLIKKQSTVLWSRGYYICTVGVDHSTVDNYINNHRY